MKELKKPMLAVACEDISTINYPVYVSPKLDGIRMLVKDGVCYSRSMKPIPSKAVQAKFGNSKYNGFDGELIYGSVVDKKVFNHTTSFCMSHDIPEGMDINNIYYYVFDKWDVEDVWEQRFQRVITGWPESTGCTRLNHTYCIDYNALQAAEQRYVDQGFEGAMVRSPNGEYKQGRSTLKQGWLLKIKRFTDDEAVVTGFIERMHNTNEAELDERGYTKRSTAKDGMVPAGTLGTIVAQHDKYGEIEIGTGFDDVLRLEIWNNQEKYLDKLVKFKYMEIGTINKPRHPVFLGFRSEDDLGE